MPTFTFTSPEGKTYDIEAPKGATKEQAFQVLQQHIGTSAPAQKTPSIGERLLGAGEAALTAGTGAIGGMLGTVGGALGGLAGSVATGQYGTQQGVRNVEEQAAKGAESLTYMPRTAEGQRLVQEYVAPAAEALVPLAVVNPDIGMLAQMAKPTAMQLATAGRGAIPKPATQAAPVGKFASVGGAATPESAQRVATAENLGFTGESALTKGQASREFAQQQFEKETAKAGDVGAPLRQRLSNQSATMLQNFDAMVDKANPINLELRGIGQSVSKAVENKANIAKKKINAAYAAARESGEMEAPVEMAPLTGAFDELFPHEGVAKNIGAVKREAQRLGAIELDENGAVVPKQMSVNNAETLRQFVNEATDWADPREARAGKIMVKSIDEATAPAGGKLYQEARKMRASYANEFENVGLTAKLLGTKGKTSERAIAYEDVFNKIIKDSPVEEMNKMRKTLLSAGAEGKQAWADLKARGIEDIKQRSLSASQTDERGNPIISADKLNKIIKQYDDEGKLDSLYGKRQAQQLRDMAEISKIIYTAPPGSVNYSGTASALRVMMEQGVLGGAPKAMAIAGRQLMSYVKDRGVRAKIQEALHSTSGKL